MISCALCVIPLPVAVPDLEIGMISFRGQGDDSRCPRNCSDRVNLEPINLKSEVLLI